MSRSANTASALNSAPANVFDAEGNRSLVGAGQNAPRLADQKKAREVALVIFDAGRQNVAFVRLRCLGAGDSGGIPQFVFDHMLDAARRVIERRRLNLRIFGEEVAALLQGHGMRVTPGADRRA